MNNQTSYNETMNGSTKAAKDLNKLSEDAGKKVGEMAAEVKSVADDYVTSGREYVARGEEYVKTNPESSMVIALGVGAVIGGLIAFALRKK
jgi:ElaB/YqjD/DUF883 family membrane-anchored ribosome-binding protein